MGSAIFYLLHLRFRSRSPPSSRLTRERVKIRIGSPLVPSESGHVLFGLRRIAGSSPLLDCIFYFFFFSFCFGPVLHSDETVTNDEEYKSLSVIEAVMFQTWHFRGVQNVEGTSRNGDPRRAVLCAWHWLCGRSVCVFGPRGRVHFYVALA